MWTASGAEPLNAAYNHVANDDSTSFSGSQRLQQTHKHTVLQLHKSTIQHSQFAGS